MAGQNYTLGRGKVYFARYKTGTEEPEGFRYIGNTPEFSLTIETEDLVHVSSDEGIREEDDSVPLSVTRQGALTTDSIRPENVALFFFGDASALTQAPVASAPETIEAVSLDHSYQLGISAANPVGYRGIDPTGFTVTGVGGTPAYVADTDFTMDFETGMLKILDTGSIVEASDIVVTYAVLASTRTRIISGSSPVEGALRYIAHNPKGTNIDYIMPKVKITPNGDYQLKGDEWQTIPFNLSILKPTGKEAIYADGRPAYA